MTLGLYILDAHGNPLAAETMTEWSEWMATRHEDRVVAKTQIMPDVLVSTVFLGIDHSFSDGQAPILYESMTFGGLTSDDQERYETKEQAIKGHEAMVYAAREANKLPHEVQG